MLSWSAILGVLRETPAEDQFGEEVRWSAFDSKPFVLVIADRESAEKGKGIGAALHSIFNGDYIAPEEHLHESPPTENIKIIPVAALPDVPGIFKWLFRRGFKKESPVGVILDWDSRLAKVCGYVPGSVAIVVKLPDRSELQNWIVRSPEEAISKVRESLK